MTLCLIPIFTYLMPLSDKFLEHSLTEFLMNNLFDLFVLVIGVSTFVISILSFMVEKDFKVPIFGGIIFFCSILHFTEIFLVAHSNRDADFSLAIEIYFWTISGIFSCLTLNSFLCIEFFVRAEKRAKRAIQLGVFSLFVLAFLIIGVINLDTDNIPTFITWNELILRPWDLGISMVYLLCATVAGFLFQRKKSPFVQGVILYCLPNICMHFYLAISLERELFVLFDIVLLQVSSYSIALISVSWSFFKNYGLWNTYYGELNIIQDAVNVSALVSETDIDGNIIFANDQFCKVSQYTKEELIGENHRIIASGVHPKGVFEGMWKTISAGHIWKGEICNKAKDGSFYWVSSTIYPSRNSDGEISKYVSIRFDITKQKELQEKVKSEKRVFELESIFFRILDRISNDSLSNNEFYQKFLEEFKMTFGWDLGHVHYVNSEKGYLYSSRVFHCEDENILGQFKKLHSNRVIKKGESISGKYYLDHRVRWMEDVKLDREACLDDLPFQSSLCFGAKNSSDILLVFEFFSVKKKTEDKEFMSVIKFLEDNLGKVIEKKKLIAEVMKEKDKAERLAVVKSEFFANMSHEIRTPMNGILGMVNLIGETQLNIDQKNMLETVKACGDSLLTIINDILDFSKIDSGNFIIENHDFNVREMISAVVSIAGSCADSREIKIDHEVDKFIPELLNGDDTRIKQILINFISNALKFTEKGGIKINVHLMGMEEENDFKILFSIKDTGIGISEKNQSKLFQAFSQADTSITRRFGGTGLGLAISSKIAELLQGRVWFESKLGQGSTFFLEVPLKKAQEEELPEKTNVIEFSQKIDTSARVLVVEDNKINQKIAKMMLKKLGIQCDIAENGVECLNKLEQSRYDLIFMDMQMPIMDGVTATIEIVKKYGKDRPKIVAMTANVFEEDRKKCHNAGMDDFVAKPISIEEVSRVFYDLAA
ncbi:PAS domain-containing hybrid sensor histidine kinase/response regulator [Halobacteriovorax sp. HLS]|uniref:PAS domain-containing hybrid sensor histidine kinase/response regulator n=1 Tax=Halobacteriovorax sp. HLS TaxID=2234000 RepID=UPI0013E3A433|nr:PAS domain-containing hybrid sensor histidine kinase/response regulator [Halobacteriovorax sp. HLS]